MDGLYGTGSDDSFTVQNVLSESMVLGNKFILNMEKTLEYNVKGNSFTSIYHFKKRTRKNSKTFSKISGQKKQELVSKITKNFSTTTTTIFKIKHFSKSIFQKKT